MMNINPKDVDLESDSGSDRKNWDETIKLILSGIGTLYSNYFEVYTQQESFGHTWSVFIQYLGNLLTRKSFGVSTTVFQVLSRVLARVGHPDNLAAKSREEVWTLWSSQGVQLVTGITNTGNGIQETLGAYVQSFRALYRLVEPTLTVEMVEKTLGILRECILFPDAPPYFQDVDMVTPLQAAILDAIKNIRTDIPGVPSLLLKHLADSTTIAFSPARARISGKGSRVPTCIALSVQCATHLEAVAAAHITDPEIYTSGALPAALSALQVPIALKYSFTPPTAPTSSSASQKRTNLWTHPTSAILSITRKALPAMAALHLPPETTQQVWSTLVDVLAAVLAASDDAGAAVDEATMRADEELDIASFRSLRSLLVPALGAAEVPDETVARYVKAVYDSSLLYPATRAGGMGSTSELKARRRTRMAYVCIDELFALTTQVVVGGGGGGGEREGGGA